MKRMLGAVAALLVVHGAARADKFEELADKAVRIEERAGLAALFWAQTTECKSDDDLFRRQCEGVREARAQSSAGKLFLVEGDAAAFSVGEWDKAKSSLPVSVRGCLACDDAVEIAGERRYLTTKGALAVQGGALRGPEIHKAANKFLNEAAAKKWRDRVAPRLRTDLLIRVPARVDPWTEGGAKGYAVELVAFRVYDPCDGAIVCANPPAARLDGDRSACKGEPVEPPPEVKVEPKVETPKEPPLPKRLSPAMITAAMQKTQSEVNACLATYGVPGSAKVTMEIGGDGVVKTVSQDGDFVDTPTGDCIVKAVKATEFPKFKDASMTVRNYPFTLR